MKNYFLLTNIVVFIILFTVTEAFCQPQKHFTNTTSVSFRENKGQVCNQYLQARYDVLFSGESQGIVFHLKKDGLHYQIHRVDSWKDEENTFFSLSKDLQTKSDNVSQMKKFPDKISIYRVDVNWKNVNKNVIIEGYDEIYGYDNFYNVPEGIEPALFVKSYKAIVYKNIYDGIDLRFYEKDGHLDYDFIIKPGANYHQIKIEIKGAELNINEEQELIINTPFGEIREGKLKVYQDNKELEAYWLLSKKENEISFEIPNYNPAKELRIDPPVRLWGTYYGGTGFDYGNSVATDEFGNVYLCGTTYSITNIATSGAHQTTIGSTIDAFLVKFNYNGIRQWGTYYGGSADDSGLSTIVDLNNYVYLAGRTASSNNIATPNSHQSTNGGGIDAYLVKFNSNGIRQWGTYYGGNGGDYGNSITIDKNNNLYLSGETSSTNYIATDNAHQTIKSSYSDAFLVKFDNSGTRLWGTYYGGNNSDKGYSVTTDTNNNVYLAGSTLSTTNISTPNAHQTTKTGSGSDGFLVKFNAEGTRLWGTYYGGVYQDNIYSINVDKDNNIYITGETNSPTNIATTGSYQSSGGGLHDAFVAKFNTSGTRLWGTYYGGTNDDCGYSIITDGENNIYIAGLSSSDNNIASTDGYQSTRAGDEDAFIAKFNSSGQRLWGTYYGGTNDDEGDELTIDANGYLFFAGETWSNTNISSPSSHQPTYGGNIDAFLVRFQSELSLMPPGLLQPPNNGTNILCNVNLQWQSVFNATSYILQVATDENFTQLIVNQNGIANTNFWVNNLNLNTTYYWRVRSSDGTNTSNWCYAWSFTTIATPYQQILLNQGWNFISTYMNINSNSLEDIFNNLNDSIILITDNYSFYFPNYGITDLEFYNITKAYLVYARQNCTLFITGETLSPEDIEIQLFAGWNYVPYLRISPMIASEALESIIDNLIICKKSNGEYYQPSNNLNTLENGTAFEGMMLPGKGYLIFVDEPCILIYPAND